MEYSPQDNEIESLKEKLSALMDDELPLAEKAYLLEKIRDDSRVYQLWLSFNVIRNALRKQPQPLLHPMRPKVVTKADKAFSNDIKTSS